MDTIAAPTHTITVAQAAEALDVSERTVWRYLKSGRLPGETVGDPGAQRTLIPAQAVEALRGSRAGIDAVALRAERDRLAAELAALRAERDALQGRVATLQRALAAPSRPGLAERALSRALEVAARARGPRVTAVR
jgi:excisionase family DNA binding protein